MGSVQHSFTNAGLKGRPLSVTTFLYQSLCCGYDLNCSCTGECSSSVQGVKRCSWTKPSNAIWSNVHDGKISLSIRVLLA